MKDEEIISKLEEELDEMSDRGYSFSAFNIREEIERVKKQPKHENN